MIVSTTSKHTAGSALRAYPRKSVFLAIFPGFAKPKSVTLSYIYLITTKYIVFELEGIR
jgi:hypothetical protein